MNLNSLDGKIVICENDYKNDLLKKLTLNHLFLNVKFFSKKEFIESITYKYDEKAIYYLMKNNNIKVDIAKMYLQNTYYIDVNKKYNNRKLDYLVKLKKELLNNNLLIEKKLLSSSLKNKEIIVYNYPYLNDYELSLFSKYNTTYINDEGKYNHGDVYELASIYDEVEFVACKIGDLLTNNIDISNIKIIGTNEEYNNIIERVFGLYNIPVKIKDRSTLYNSKIGKDFIKNYNSDINITIDSLSGYDKSLINKIVSICNKYTFTSDYYDVKDLIINDLKNVHLNEYPYKKYVTITDISSPFNEDDYVFYMNFNMGSSPIYLKDEDYITDNIKPMVGLSLTDDINKKVKEFYINKINSIKNITITYKKMSTSGESYPSSLINDMNLNVIKCKKDITKSYSYLSSKLDYAKRLDLYYKYGASLTDDIYISTFKDIDYNTFDNRFKGIDNTILEGKLNGLNLSYSSLDSYNKCAFSYYLKYILKVDAYEQSFEAMVGSIFHAALERGLKEGLSSEEVINDYIKENNIELTLKERFFISKIKDDIDFTLNYLRKQNSIILFDNALYEQNITIDLPNKYGIKFTGFVDKVLYKKFEDKDLLAIVDYKTGMVETSLAKVPLGLSMQLPIYAYLLKKGGLFNSPVIVGFYIEYLLNKDVTSKTKTYEENLEDNLKLVGYTIDNTLYLSEFDPTYSKSDVIKSMSTKADGTFGAYAKVLSETQIDKIIDKTDEVINKTVDAIGLGNFDINPKKFGYDDDYSCKFCKFKDICFKKNEDYIIYDKDITATYLEDDENA